MQGIRPEEPFSKVEKPAIVVSFQTSEGDSVIDLGEIKKIALLARLEVTPEKASEYALQLQKVLNHFDQIAQVNTDGIEPLLTPTEIETYWREDIVSHELTPNEIVANAPDKIGHLFRVPPVI